MNAMKTKPKRKAIPFLSPGRRLPSVSTNQSRDGHGSIDSPKDIANPRTENDEEGGGHSARVPLYISASSDLIALIRECQAQRVATLRMQNRINNQARSLARRHLGWQVDQSETDRKAVNVLAGKVVDAIEADEPTDLISERDAKFLRKYVLASQHAREMFDAHRKHLESVMEESAEKLPVYKSFVEPIRGLGALGLAIIVGECGDIGSYRNPSGIWKRLGLAPIVCYRMITKEGKEAFQKPKRRRSAMYTVGDSLLKNNKERESKEDEWKDAYYRRVYLERKEYERLRDEKIERKPEEKAMSKMHIHRRAQRYMEKRLLKHLWQAWRGHEKTDNQNDGASPSCP